MMFLLKVLVGSAPATPLRHEAPEVIETEGLEAAEETQRGRRGRGSPRGRRRGRGVSVEDIITSGECVEG